MVDKAREEARRTMRRLAGDMPVIGLEPSCLLTLRDEYRSLLPGADADRWPTGRCCSASSWRMKSPIWRCGRCPATAHVHGHCHQKAFGAFPIMLASVEADSRDGVTPIVSSCCGMAGAFGYQAET